MLSRKYKLKRCIPNKYDTLEDYFLNNPHMVKVLVKAIAKNNKLLLKQYKERYNENIS